MAAKPRIRVRADGSIPRQASVMALAGGGRAYDAARTDLPGLTNWYGAITTSNEEILVGRDDIVGRARALVRNDPAIAGAVDRLTESVVGAKMWPEAEPDYEAMGRSADWADTWATMAEAKWRSWANDPLRRCDVDRKSKIPEMFRTAYRHWLIDGEACAIVQMVKGRGKYQTALKLIDPDRLSNPDGMSDEQKLANGNSIVGGVEISPGGDPVAYHIRKEHPASRNPDGARFTWLRIPRYAPSGRPVFIHAFRQDRADQRRGVSRLASAMTRIKQSDKYSKAELDAALFDALNIATFETPAPASDVRDALAPAGNEADSGYLDRLVRWRAENKVHIDGLRVIQTYPGEKYETNKPSRPSGNFDPFIAVHDRKIAGGIGLSYPHYSQNWGDINYSSGRLMRNEMWRGIFEDRELFSQEFGTPIWLAFHEEAAALGEIKIPGGPANFYRWSSELFQVSWMGPGPGYGDPKKEAEANEIEMRYNGKTLAMIGADNGVNSKQVLFRRSREKKFIESLKNLTDITDAAPVGGPGRPASSDADAAQEAAA